MRTLLITLLCAPAILHAQWDMTSTFSFGVATKIAIAPPQTVALYDRDRLAVSTDDGVTFNEGGDGIDDIYDMESRGSDLIAVGPASAPFTHGCFVSRDQGATFSLLGGVAISGGAVTQVIVDGDRLILSSNRATMWVSTDDGTTWRTVSTPETCGYIIDADVRGSTWVIAGLSASALSTDDGMTWTVLPPTTGGIGISYIRLYRGEIIGGTIRGAWKWSGSQWVIIPGLPEFATITASIQDLQTDADRHLCVVATPFSGQMNVYRYDGSDFVAYAPEGWSPSHGAARGMLRPAASATYVHYVALSGDPRGTYRHANLPSSVDDDAVEGQTSVWPNPATTQITISGLDGHHGLLRIRDNVGRIITESTHAGQHDHVVDLRSLLPGVYTWSIGQRSGVFVRQ